MIYVDYTASGRSIDFIEDLIRDHVLPYYSNTHSDSNFTAEVISTYRREARFSIKIKKLFQLFQYFIIPNKIGKQLRGPAMEKKI